MNKSFNRYVGLVVGLLLGMVYSQSYASDEMQDTINGIAELIAPAATHGDNVQPKELKNHDVSATLFAERAHGSLEYKAPVVVSNNIQKIEPESNPIDDVVEKKIRLSEPVIEAEKLATVKIQAINKIAVKAVEETKNKRKKSCDLCLGFTQIEREPKANGSVQIKATVIVMDNKGRLVLGSPVIFYANNEAVPNIYDTQTNVNGEAIFTFTTFSKEASEVEVKIGGNSSYIQVLNE